MNPLELPSTTAIEAADNASPLRRAQRFSELADADELTYREHTERYDEPVDDVVRGHIEGKKLVDVLERSLELAGLEPHGTLVELGAGSCWLSATLARSPRVDRAIGVEFSERRLRLLAPIALAYLKAPPGKVERLVADFYNPGLPTGEADFVFTEGSFHHAADPGRLAQVAFDLLRPGGRFVLFREPTLSFLRRTRDHGVEDDHGAFEHEYYAREYLDFLTNAGFAQATKVRVPYIGASGPRKLFETPPLSWLNGVVFNRFLYVGTKADSPAG